MKRHGRDSWIACITGTAFALLTLGTSLAQQTTTCGTCRDPNNAQDRSYCDPTTNQCVHQYATCAPYFVDAQGHQNLCQPLQGTDPQTGDCIYQNKFCPPTGCLTQACNPATGQCEKQPDTTGACGPAGDAACDSTSCPSDQCVAYTCKGFGQTGCDLQIPRDCTPVGSCRQGIAPPDGCDPRSGCLTQPVACAPPSNPCIVLVRNPDAADCCTYAPRDCAGEYGNNPNYTYSCDPNHTQNVCIATPVPVGPPKTADQCKNGGYQKFNYPRTFKNQGDCIQFVKTGK